MAVGFLFCGVQPIVSTCIAMTKTDVRRYSSDLLTLSYVRNKISLFFSTSSSSNEQQHGIQIEGSPSWEAIKLENIDDNNV